MEYYYVYSCGKQVFHEGKWIDLIDYFDRMSDPIDAAFHRMWEQEFVEYVDAVYGTNKEA